jgi:hypothetical protein
LCGSGVAGEHPRFGGLYSSITLYLAAGYRLPARGTADENDGGGPPRADAVGRRGAAAAVLDGLAPQRGRCWSHGCVRGVSSLLAARHCWLATGSAAGASSSSSLRRESGGD